MADAVVLIVLSAFFIAASQAVEKHYCSSLKPIKDLPVEKLQGNWITLNELLFKEGIPAAPSQGDSVRHNQCVQHVVTPSQSGKRQQLLWEPSFSFLRGHESKGSPFYVTKRPNGRWRLRSEDGRPMLGCMMMLESEPEVYFVRAICFPEKGTKRLLLKAVTIESRRTQHQEGRGALGAEQLLQVKTRVAKLLGLAEFKPAQFGLFC